MDTVEVLITPYSPLPPPPLPAQTFAVSFCWSESNAEIQVAHCFLEQVPVTWCLSFLQVGHIFLELPPELCHSQDLSLDPDTPSPPQLKRFFLVALLLLFARRDAVFFMCRTRSGPY